MFLFATKLVKFSVTNNYSPKKSYYLCVIKIWRYPPTIDFKQKKIYEYLLQLAQRVLGF